MISDETDPDLLSLQARIREAADRDDAAGVAAACLAHARLIHVASLAQPGTLDGKDDTERNPFDHDQDVQADRASALGDIARTLAKLGDAEAAREIAYSISDEYSFTRGAALQAMVQELVQIASIEEALKTAHAIETTEHFKAKALETVAKAQILVGDEAGANATFNAAWTASHQIDDKIERLARMTSIAMFGAIDGSQQMLWDAACDTDVRLERDGYLYGMVLQLLEGAGTTEVIEETIAKMHSAKWRNGAMSTLADSLAFRGEFAESERVIDKIKSPERRERAYLNWHLTRAMSVGKSGGLDEARKKLALLVEIASRIRTKKRRQFALLSILRTQLNVGLPAEAFSTLQLKPPSWGDTKILAEIAKAEAELRHIVSARIVTAKIESPADKPFALIAIAEAEFAIGSVAAARATFEEALQNVRAINDDSSRVWVTWVVTSKQIQLGLIVDTETAISEICDDTDQIRDSWQRSFWVASLATEFVKLGFLEQSIHFSVRITYGRGRQLLKVVEAIAGREQVAPRDDLSPKSPYFKQMLSPCAYEAEATFGVCGLLAALYPAQAKQIGRIIAAQGS